MKTKRNYKLNRICRKLYSKYRKNVISLVTAAVLLVTSMPLADVSSVVSKIVSTLTNAISAMAEEQYTDISGNISNNVYTIQNADDLKNLLNANPEVYQDITIRFSNTNQFTDTAFKDITKGLGTEKFPFKGTVVANTGSGITLPINFALFDYLSDSATLDKITFVRPADYTTALLAENVIHDESTEKAKNWEIAVNSVTDSNSQKYSSFTSVIGTIGKNSVVGLDITLESGVTVEVSGGNNAGLACGSMDENASLTVSMSNSSLDVSGAENAGTFVGEMNSGATLNIGKCDNLTDNVVSAKNAGGLVGSAENAEINVGEDITLTMTGSVTGSVTAGGLFGSYTYSKTDSKEFDISKFSGAKMTLDCPSGSTAEIAAVGSVFGVLTNSTESAKISIKGTANDTITSNFKGTVSAGFYGGVIGRYSANKLGAGLALSDINVNVTGTCNALDFGGLIGKIGDNSKAYVSVNNATVSVEDGTISTNNYGGLVGYADQAFVNVGGKVTVTAKNVSADESVGGIVGKFNNNGIVRLSGETDLSIFYPAAPNKNRCQIVGNRSNALVYGASGWTIERTSEKTIDDMDWGGVLCLNDKDLLESADGVLSFDEAEHTVTIKGFDNKDNLTINNVADFARAALIMQHTSNDFVQYDGISRTEMLAANISLSADVDISDTGLTCFMRDNGDDTFKGMLDGNNNKLTMNVGKNASIVYHDFNGLFAKTGAGAEISDLDISATFNVIGRASGSDYCYIGALSAQSVDTLTISGVKSDMSFSTSENNTIFVGGMVGYISDITGEISFSDSSSTPALTYGGKKDSVCIGGVVGVVDKANSADNDYRKISFNKVTVGGKITENGSRSNSRVGGLIAEIRAEDKAENSQYFNNVEIKDVKVSGLAITTKGTKTSGGFLGHNWYRTNVTLDSLTVSSSTLSTACEEFGGLVTATTGYWKITDITFDKNSSITGNNAIRFGMLIDSTLGRTNDSYGYNYSNDSNTNSAKCEYEGTYVEFVESGEYNIDSTTELEFGANLEKFDEIAAYSMRNDAYKTGNGNGQSVISIPAVYGDSRKVIMNGTECNTYQNQTSIDIGNTTSRYYYNLDAYREAPANASEKLLIWSVYNYAADNIKSYFESGSASPFSSNAEFDMNGYSYYPIDMFDYVNVRGTVKFYNDKIQQAEELSSDGVDTYERKTTGDDSDHTQHYLMHHGLFRNVTNLTVGGKLVLQGNIGKANGGSGALVCGNVQSNGYSKGSFSVSSSASVYLDGIYVNTDINESGSYAPLLINKVTSSTIVSVANVSAKFSENKSDYGLPSGRNYAATSLIGDVGDNTAFNITLSFSGIRLAAYPGNSIFSNATLAESFMYDKNCSGTYNYTYDEDWGKKSDGSYNRNVTYGREVSESKKNPNMQRKYYKDSVNYTAPEYDKTDALFSFIDYLPYIAKTAVTGHTDSKYHEIDVNISKPDLTDGCGSYSDPYIITDGAQLEAVASALDGAINKDWKVNYNSELDVTKAQVDANSAFCSQGSKHSKYTYESSTFVNDDGDEVSDSDMKKYLSESYYLISKDIELSSNFLGLGTSPTGTTTAELTFRGVIIGKTSDGAVPTVINKSTNSLIRFSNGSVVKDLNIVNAAEIDLKKDKNSQINFTTQADEIYGGVMGVVFGGDNIIDNVKVTHPKINLTGNYSYLIPAGGYVGAIVYGGVIFRNMGSVAKDSALTTKNTVAVGEDVYKNLFVNPYIGRVVNGFAIEEGDSFGKSTNLDNKTKNYIITKFNKNLSDADKLDVTTDNGNGIMNVHSAQALFMVSIITQSGMGYTVENNNTCGYGHYTFTRSANYSKVGSDDLTSSDPDYTVAISDYQRLENDNNSNRAFDKKASVLLKKYSTANSKGLYEAKWCYDKSFTINFDKGKTYDLTGTGFRGINRLFKVTDSEIGLVSSYPGYQFSNDKIIVNGNSCDLIIYTMVKSYISYAADYGNYSSDQDNYQYNYFEADRYNHNLKGLGFINSTQREATFNDLVLSGNVIMNTINSVDGNYVVNEDLATGGLIGVTRNNVTINNITIGDLDIHGAYTTGGLIGKANLSEYNYKVSINGISSTDNGSITTYGAFETGGIIGSIQYRGSLVINGDTGSDGKQSVLRIGKVQFAELTRSYQDWFGTGGIAGSVSRPAEISNLALVAADDNSFIGSSDNNGDPIITHTMNTGGIIGCTSSAACTINNVSVGVSLYGCDVGGLVGRNGSAVTAENCQYGVEAFENQPSINGFECSGGMVGYQNTDFTVSKSVVKNASIMSTNDSTSEMSLGGFVGRKNAGTLTLKDCEVDTISLLANNTAKKSRVGGVVGRNSAGNEIKAYDILVKDVTYDENVKSDSLSGNIIGDNGNKTSTFIGVSVINNKYYRDDAKNATNFTAIHSDYKGIQTNEEEYGEGSDDHVSINSPYVNINPSFTVGGKTFTGDFVGGNMQNIIKDAASYTDGTTTKSFGRNETLKGYANDVDTSKLTTFKEASELDVAGLNELPVLLIDDNSSANITPMLAKYISLLTNYDVCDSTSNKLKTDTDLMNVSTATYVYDNGALEEAKATTLTFNSKTGYFKVTDGQYDNDGTNRFTVITLDYTDPTESSKTALRLHIPVFVRKVLDFSFQSYVISGTDYNHTHYTDETKLAFESFDAPVTTYFKYSYYKSADEWAKMLNNGDSLLWSFDKEIYLLGDDAAASGVLTNGTKLTLIDANNNDKTYHSTALEAKFNTTTGELDLTKINGFKPVTMNDILLKYATVTATATTSSDGTLVEATDKSTATVKTSDGKYYRPAGENETGIYKITVSANSDTQTNNNGEMIISESYYLTISIPAGESDNKVIKNYVKYYSGTTQRKLTGNIPTNLVHVTNNDTGTYVIANFFTQEVNVTAHDPEEITTSNNSIHATMTSKISIDPELKSIFNGYKANNFKMYQAFKFFMREFNENDKGSNARIIAGASVSADYSILNSSGTELESAKKSKTETLSESQDSYMLMYPDSVYDFINDDTNGSITVVADLWITYGPSGIIDQFPERKEGDNKTGIGVNAASYVAYSKNNIENSSISENGTMPATRYYRMAMTVAQLSYNVAESTVLESKDSPFSQLGINAKDMTSDEMMITAKAIYDLSELSQSTRNSGTQIQYTMKLYVKDDNGDYQQTDDISKYLSSFTLENTNTNSELSGNEYVFTTDYSGDEQSTAVTKFTVKTGKTFEAQGLTYANYRVELTAVLLNDNNSVVNGTTASDYVVYTNAKIETGFIN